MNANGKIFNSITDRLTISDAYNRIVESENSENPSTVVSYAFDFINETYPNISENSLLELNEIIAKTVKAEDSEDFTYLLPDIEIEVDIEELNDGTEEDSVLYEYPRAVHCDAETIEDVPNGTILEFYDDYENISNRLDKRFEGDCRSNVYSHMTIGSVWYILCVTNPFEFQKWIENISDENNILLDGSDSENANTEIHESDALKRSIANIKQDGPDEYGNFEDENSLDGRINLRGRAASLRDYEVNQSSHFSNIMKCYDNNKDMLEKLEKDLENEGLVDIAIDVLHLIGKLEDSACDAEDKLYTYQRDVKRPYHLGTGHGFLKRPNYVGHDKFSL